MLTELILFLEEELPPTISVSCHLCEMEMETLMTISLSNAQACSL